MNQHFASLVPLDFILPPLQRESTRFGSGIHDKHQCIILWQREDLLQVPGRSEQKLYKTNYLQELFLNRKLGKFCSEFKSNLNLKASSQNVVNRTTLTWLTKKNLLRKTNQELFNMRNHCWFRKFTQLQVPGGWKDTGKVMFPFFLYFPG